MKSAVYFCDLKGSMKRTFKSRFREMIQAAELKRIIPKGGLVAIKIHFGEAGNTSYVRPVYARWVVEMVKEAGGKPFLTDCNTLYVGSRGDTVSHLETALANGFGYTAVAAPLVIADGLRGRTEKALPVDGRQVKEAYFGAELLEADAIVSLAHFKAHELAGFGGALKNLGMGGASRRGKMVQHATVSPAIDENKCIGCGTCVEVCPQEAISLDNDKASLDGAKCIGCGSCLLACPNQAIDVDWSKDSRDSGAFQETMAEYTAALVKSKPGRLFCLNVLTQLSPFCDCPPTSGAPIAPDIGFLASLDPVALDQASYDLVNAQISFVENCPQGADKFRALSPKVDPQVQLIHAEKMGAGSREYKLETIP